MKSSEVVHTDNASTWEAMLTRLRICGKLIYGDQTLSQQTNNQNQLVWTKPNYLKLPLVHCSDVWHVFPETAQVLTVALKLPEEHLSSLSVNYLFRLSACRTGR